MSGDYRMTVFENGFVLAVSGRRYTVIRADECGEYTYFHPDYTSNDLAYGKPDSIDESVFLDQAWPIGMMLTVDDAFQKNEDNRERRKLSRHPEIPDDRNWMNGGYASFEGSLIARMDLEMVLDELTEKQRMVFQLHQNGWNQRMIGERLGITQPAVQKHLTAAIKKISKNL